MKFDSKRFVSIMFTLFMLTILVPITGADRIDESTHVNFEGSLQVVDIDLVFDPLTITEVTFEDLSYVTAEGYSIPFDEGNAALPFKTIQVLVHPEAVDLKIEIQGSITTKAIFVYPVAGVPRSVPFSIPEEVHPGLPDVFPENFLSISGEGWTRGMRIVDIRFDPIILSGDGTYLTANEIRAGLSYRIPENSNDHLVKPFSRSTSVFRSSLEKDLYNPEDIARFGARPFDAPIASLEVEDIQYVVITNTSKVQDGFDEFIEWKNRKGIPTRLVETSFIDDHYTGTDMPERIRNFIMDAVNSWETEFVLLGGDIAVVPHRGAYAKVYSSTQTSNPCDLYFSDLDGTWNADGDNYWGETNDNVDLRPDVYVGRAPVQSEAETLTYVKKTLIYEMEPPSGYLDNATFAGEFLDETTNSSRGMDLIKNNLLSTNYNTTSMYDSAEGVFGNLNRITFMNQVDLGGSLVYHSGHCNWNVMSVGTAGSGSMYNSHISDYSSEEKYGLLNTIGCIANKFSQNDAIVEKHILEPDGGTIAGIGNSHYGWYAYGYPGFGPSEQFMYRMTSELFQGGHTRMAEHFAEGKDYFVSSSGSYNSARWIQIVLNLMGDPEVKVRTAEPGILNISMPGSIGMSYDGFPIKVRHENGTPIKDALVCMYKSDYYSYALTDNFGEARFNFTTEELDQLNITITAHNYLPFQKNISLDMMAPRVHLDLEGVGTTGDDYIFNCSVFDEVGIENVHLFISNETNILELEEKDGNWIGNISIPWNSTEPIPFKVLAMDRSGNKNTTDWYNLTVVDDDLPWLVEDMGHHDAFTGESYNFKVKVGDNIGVSSVIVDLEEATGLRSQKQLQLIGGNWSYEYQVPNDSIGPRYYNFTISDTSGNRIRTSDRSFSVQDDEPPKILEDISDRSATTSDPFTFRINVSDNIAIGSVHLVWWKDEWTIPNNDTLDTVNGTWETTIQASSEDLSSIHYSFHVSDSSGNWNNTSDDHIVIIDNDLPFFLSDPTEPFVNAGDEISFRINVIDNVGIQRVKLFYAQGSGTENEIILTQGSGNLWGYSQRMPSNSIEPINYRFLAEDISGNVNYSDYREIEVLDLIPPVLEDLDIPASVLAGSAMNVSVQAYDNICIKKITLTWWFGGTEPEEIIMDLDGNEYLSRIEVPIDAYGTLYLTVKLRDGSDNTIISDREDALIIEHVEEKLEDPEENDDRIPVQGEDLDNDGMDDLWEFNHGLDLKNNDSLEDPDNDDFTNIEEYLAGTDPQGSLSFPLDPDEGNDIPLDIILTVAVLLILFIGAAILLVVMKRKEEDPPVARLAQDGHGHSHVEKDMRHIHANHPSALHSGNTGEPHHSNPLTGDGIAHPHQHPVHPKE